MKKETVKTTIGIIAEILCIASSIYIIDKIINKYTEMVLKMPFAPKPKHLILICVLIVIFAIYAIRLINYKFIFVITKNKPLSEYEKYLLAELYGSSYVENLEQNNKIQKKLKKKDKGGKEENNEKNIENNEESEGNRTSSSDKDILAFMLNNSKGIKEYFEISKEQEKKSYSISIGCAVVGVFILAFSIGAIFFGARIEATIITMIAGAITEVVSGIVLWIHNKSAAQLNYYYNALHENEKVLLAINLADKLGYTEKKQMYMEIIKAQVSAKGGTEEKLENNA